MEGEEFKVIQQTQRELKVLDKRRKTQAVERSTPEHWVDEAMKAGKFELVEKFLEYQERIKKEAARDAFYVAMTEFQANCPDLQKMKTVKYTPKDPSKQAVNYKYIELAAIQKAIRKPMADAKLSIGWDTVEHQGEITVVCTVTHVLGHSVSTSLTGRADDTGNKNAIQQKASTITYLRRYTATGLLGISSADIDDDGRGGPEVGNGLRPPSDAQFKDIMVKLTKKAITIADAEKLYSFDAGQMHSMNIAAK